MDRVHGYYVSKMTGYHYGLVGFEYRPIIRGEKLFAIMEEQDGEMFPVRVEFLHANFNFVDGAFER